MRVRDWLLAPLFVFVVLGWLFLRPSRNSPEVN